MSVCWYAVSKGRKIGVYDNWEDCRINTFGYPGAKYRKFTTKEEAEKFAFSSFPDVPDRPMWIPDARFSIENDLNKLTKKKRKRKVPSLDVRSLYDERSLSVRKSDEKIHAWVTGKDGLIPMIAVYFGKDDRRNEAATFQWTKPADATRMGIAATVRAVSIVTKHLYDCGKGTDGKVTTLVIHVGSIYLLRSLERVLLEWSRDKRFSKCTADKNRDIYEVMYRQLTRTGLRIMPVHDTKKEESEGLNEAQRLIENHILGSSV